MHRVERFDIRALPDDALRGLHGLEESLRIETEPDEPPRPFENYAAAVRSMPAVFEVEGFLVRDESGGVAGEAEAVFFSTPENAHLTQVSLSVRAPKRRRGIGGALLAAVVEVALSRGRQLIMGATDNRIPAGEEFARHFGAKPGNTSRVARLDLSRIDSAVVDEWIEQGPTRAPGYSLVRVDGRCPDDMVADVVELLGVMNDAPIGDLNLDDRRVTVEQLRDTENQRASVGSEHWWIFARQDDSGALAGLTEVTWNPSFPKTVRQGDTGVLMAHRGHALGKWMKAAMLRRVLDARPQVVDVRTSNADSNAAMLGINDALGFEPYIAQTVWQVPVIRMQEQVRS